MNPNANPFPGYVCPVAVCRWYVAEYGPEAAEKLREAASEGTKWRALYRDDPELADGIEADAWDRRLGTITQARRLLRALRPVNDNPRP